MMANPYRTPRVKVGHTVACLVRGEVEVDGITEDVPIPWPYVAGIGGKRSLILCADLVRAVKKESVQTVCRLWGVSRWQVGRWRRALGVPRMNVGTRVLWEELAGQRLTPESRRKGSEASRLVKKRVKP